MTSEAASTASGSHVGRKRERRVEEIMRAAAVVFAERGYDGANFEEIGARLDMRGPSLYYYFDSKEALLRGCLDRVAVAVTGRARELAEGPGSVRVRLRRMFADQVLVQVRDYPEFIPLFMRLQLTDPGVREHAQRLRRTHGDVYRRLVESGIASGELAPSCRRSLLHAFGAISYVQEWYHPDGDTDPEVLSREIADEVLRLFPRGRRRST